MILTDTNSVPFSCSVQLFVTPWTATCQAFLSVTNSQSLLKSMTIESVMPSNHLILHGPFILLPSIFASIRVSQHLFQSVRLCIRWPKYCTVLDCTVLEVQSTVLPMNIQDWLPLGIDWFDHLAVQGTLRSLLHYHSSKASILQHSAFFIMVQLSHPYMITGKTIALTIWTFVGKGMSLLFNTLSW